MPELKRPKVQKWPDVAGLPVIEMSRNWNGKLWTTNFTTIRLWNPKKFVVGKDYHVRTGNSQFHYTTWGRFKLLAATQILLSDIDDYTAYLDTGYGAVQTIAMLQQMYKEKVDDVDTALFGRYLLHNTKDD